MVAASSATMQSLATVTMSDLDMVSFLRKCLLDSSLPVPLRWRSLFSLRNYKGATARQALVDAMSDESNLLAHEAAFALGQMQDAEAISALRHTLQGVHEFHPIVRHEVSMILVAVRFDGDWNHMMCSEFLWEHAIVKELGFCDLWERIRVLKCGWDGF